MLRLVIVNIICKICVNFRQEIHESVLQKMRQLNLLWNIFNRDSTIRLLTSSFFTVFYNSILNFKPAALLRDSLLIFKPAALLRYSLLIFKPATLLRYSLLIFKPATLLKWPYFNFQTSSAVKERVFQFSIKLHW